MGKATNRLEVTRRPKVLVWCLVAGFVAAAGIAMILVGAVEGLCGWDVTAQSVSPNGRVTAQVVEGSCGATTPHYSHVDFRYLASPGEAERVFSGKRLEDVSIRWVKNSHLEISIRSNNVEDIFWQVSKVGSIAISYMVLSDRQAGN